MIPPVPTETLPTWVQEKMKRPRERFAVGDKVYGYLYNEPNGYVIEVDNEEGFIHLGWNFDPVRGEFLDQSKGAIYCVKYD